MNSINRPDATTTVKLLEISDEYAGQRIDNFLVTYLKGVPKSYVYRILRKGEVRVNKGRIKPVYRLQTGDVVRIPPVRASAAKSGPSQTHPIIKKLEKSILYEDKDILVINKPTGIAVHGGSGVDFGVIEGMRQLYTQVKRMELVHRLDKETSGCLILAKKASALKFLHTEMREGRVEKHYHALVKGRVGGDKRVLDFPLRKFVAKSGERFVKVDSEGKPAKTILTVEQRYAEASLVSLELLTGRTHQIRVHCAQIKHPIIGDEKYGDEEFNQHMKTIGIKRLCLHARHLRFPLPSTGEYIDVDAPLDNAFQSAIKTLNQE